MGFLGNIITWVKSIFTTIGTTLKSFADRAWDAFQPFMDAVFTEAKKEIIESLQDIAIVAIQQVMAQGLLTDKAKQKAFADILQKAAKDEGLELKDSMLNFLRETALTIYKGSVENE